MSRVQDLLRQAEIESETTSAAVRFVLFLVLAALVFSVAETGRSGQGAELAVSLYGLGSVAGFILAWRRIVHPVLPYLLVTFDVVLVVTQVLLLTRLMEMRPTSAFSLPAASLIFIVLIHASMRYRPWLVVYAAAIFVASVEVGMRSLGPDPAPAMHGMPSMSHDGMAGLLNYQLLPIVLIGLAAFILFVIGRRTRRLLVTSLEQMTRTTRLARYFSPNLAARLAEADDDRALAGRRLPVAVLFVDIRGFTAIGETLSPEELGAFLSDYRNRLTGPVFSHGGTVDKFIGDAIMAVFGSPIQRDDDARRALSCAIAILDAAAQWSEERRTAGQPPVGIGIGAHYGEVFAGALGNEQLLEYTVIGDTVNVAERLERLSREVDSPFVVSAALLEAAGDAAGLATWRRLPARELRGHRQIVEALCLVEDGAEEVLDRRDASAENGSAEDRSGSTITGE